MWRDNYAIQTGNCSYAFKYVTEDAEEYEFYLYIQGLYQRGGWTVDGLIYQPEGLLITMKQRNVSYEASSVLEHCYVRGI